MGEMTKCDSTMNRAGGFKRRAWISFFVIALSTLVPRFPVLATVVLSLNPEVTTVTQGQQFDLGIQVQAGNEEVDGASGYLNFDPAILHVVSVTGGGAFGVTLQNTFDNALGHVDYAAGELTAPFPSGTFTLATITFLAAGVPGTPITFDSAMPRRSEVTRLGTSVLGQAVGGAVTVTLNATGTETPTNTPTACGGSTPSATLTPKPSPNATPTPTGTPVDATALLCAELDTTDTVVELCDGSTFPSSGTIRIDDEVLYYAGKSGDTLTGVVRGVVRTAPSAHAAGSRATWIVSDCTGDCNGDQLVTVDELITAVNVALGQSVVAACPWVDRDLTGRVTVDEIVAAVNSALEGCAPIGKDHR